MIHQDFANPNARTDSEGDIVVNETLDNAKDVVFAAVSHDGWALQYASPELKNDKDVVLKTIENNVMALHYASDDLQNDEDIKAIAESYEDFDDLGDDDPGDIGD